MGTKQVTTLVYKTPIKIKLLVGVMSILLIGIYLWSKDAFHRSSIIMSNYGFNEVDGLVTVHGSWLSSTAVLANPLQTVEIECFRDLGHCFSYTAELSDDNYLSVSSELYEIEDWREDMVITRPNKFSCVEYQLTLNRRSKTATNIRHTINNTSEFCTGIQNEPITLTLGDGDRRIQDYRSKN